MTNYWNSNNISNRKRENYLKENSGFCKLYKLIEKLGLPVNKSIMVYKKVMDPRNKIIHSGEKPTREIAEEACKETKLFIEFHKIPIFS